jgi:hypothetical protein
MRMAISLKSLLNNTVWIDFSSCLINILIVITVVSSSSV